MVICIELSFLFGTAIDKSRLIHFDIISHFYSNSITTGTKYSSVFVNSVIVFYLIFQQLNTLPVPILLYLNNFCLHVARLMVSIVSNTPAGCHLVASNQGVVVRDFPFGSVRNFASFLGNTVDAN